MMMQFLRRLANDRRGNALIIAGASLPLLVGAAGLGSDTIQWVLWKRELQRAADTAALSGAYAEVQGNESVSSAVAAHMTDNNHTGIALLSGYPQISYPADVAGSYTNAVRVTLAMQQTLGFSSLFLSTPPTITTTATAALVNTGSYCVVALNGSTSSSITIGGSSSVNMGCGAISNSTSPTASVGVNGASYNFVADPVAGVGGMPASINGATEIQPHHVAMQDPYAGKYPTSDAGMTCNKQVNAGNTNLSPGCYKSFKFTGNGSYNLAPGVYYLHNTDFDVQGTVTIHGTGVTFILTGDAPGSVSTNGNSGIQLTAPTSGTYKDMLFIGMGTANTTINGDNTSFYDGAMYFPNSQVSFTGNSGTMTQCAMVVANFVNFSGNTNLQNTLTHPNGDPCEANTQVEGKAVRLIG
jgi:Flp pilus assembly protein TadG